MRVNQGSMTDGLEWRDDPIDAESDEGMEGSSSHP